MSKTTSQSIQKIGMSATMMRWPVALGLAVIVAVSLLWTMQYMIATANAELSDVHEVGTLAFIRVKQPEETVLPPDELVPPPPPVDPPPPPVLRSDTIADTSISFRATAPRIEEPLPGPVNIAGLSEGGILPIVKVAPVYPSRARARNLEGSCVVQYTVTRTGTVADAQVVDGRCSSQLFARPSVQAALKFKYRPRVVNGEAVEVAGVLENFVYRLE